ncbi:ABC transporter ATP-binding protein [Benzoatithermus flavus]|uniref:ABC transporter ATP-binding protein n=1 Tax=Benzoatithermus flavus TaxID=3108223 RepID=A0ABU8XSN9_9PROT
MVEPLLAIRDLRVEFKADGGKIQAVAGVSFDVPAHRTVAVVGESGSGKTVISQAVLGILPANARITGGSIFFDDPETPGMLLDLAALPQEHPTRRAIRGGRISIIFQEPMSSLSPLHTIGNQIREALMLHHDVDEAEARERTVEMLHRVGFPNAKEAARHYPFELSGGLRQRAMIAMALICRPAVLIADEPTTALDVTIQAQILKLMKDLQAEFGMSILFISHDLGVVANIADEIVVLYRGRVMERGPTAELLTRPQHPYLKALLDAVPRLHTRADQRLVALREVKVDHNLRLGRNGPARDRPQGNSTILEVESLRKVFLTRRAGWLGGEGRRVVAVDDVSFSVRRGETLAIVGESGSGKTTVSKMIMRAIQPDGGRITFCCGGEGPIDVLALDERELQDFRHHIQYIFQDPFGSLDPRMTVADIVAEPLQIHGVKSEAERLDRVKRLLHAVGLDVRHMRRYPHSFSGGQRQRIGIARALALEPEILICDEPVSALDVSVQAQILNLLKDLQRELGLTYLFISHNLAVVKYIAQRIAVMCAGRMVELAPTERLFASPRHPYTKTLLAAVPEPDLDNPLDFKALASGRMSEPALWPAPFTLVEGSGRLHEVEPGHFVRLQT